jgi:Fe-S-cluster containining protein
MSVKETVLACGGCTACCENDAVGIHPELGDNPKEYRAEIVGERLVLAHQDNGDCIYLERGKGCTIWNRRPALCREFDCRVFIERVSPEERVLLRVRGMVTQEQIDAAFRMRRIHGPRGGQ